MDEENRELVWAQMKWAANELRGKLPPSWRHPKGRNPDAHVAKCIKNKFRKSYRDISDENVGEVLEYIDYLTAKDLKRWKDKQGK